MTRANLACHAVSLLGVLGVLVFHPVDARAGTYYVDGACPRSGTGALLACGADGPFVTIMEAVKAAARTDGYNPTRNPITINVRGAHDGFDGIYNEYIGLWGNGSVAAPGGGAYYALNCAPGAECVIQGCPASACGRDETAVISGLAQRRDWHETAPGSGIWLRTMEPRSEYTFEFALADTFDPGFVLQGARADRTRKFLQYSQSATAPGEGRWYYDPATHRAYVNPIGAGNPNTDPNTRIWVPDHRVMWQASADCPVSTCPPTNRLTLRRLDIEGGRYVNMHLGGNGNTGNTLQDIVLDSIAIRYSLRFGWVGSRFHNLAVRNLTVEHMARGASTVAFEGSFGIRLFHIDHGTLTNITSSHQGSAGDAAGNVGGCSGGGAPGVWLDSPWNDKAGNPHCMNGNGLDLKQSNGVVVRGYRCSDVSNVCLQIDETRDSEITDCTIQRAKVGIRHVEFTPDAVGGADSLKNNLIHGCRIDDAGWNDNGAVNLQTTNDTLGANEFTVKFYNNFISHAALAGIFVSQNNGAGGSTSNRVYIWNNTIWASRSTLNYPPQTGGGNAFATTPAAGIVVDTGQVDRTYHVNTLSNFDVRNNIIAGMDAGGLVVPGSALATTNVTIDDNLYQGNSAPNVAIWKGSVYSAVGPSSPICTGPRFECHGTSGAAAFVNTAAKPPDLHIQSTSAAVDKGADLSAGFAWDIDAESRPQGVTWDIGADELRAPVAQPAAPSLIEVVPVSATP